MSIELFQKGPAVYLPILIISLLITMIAYGAFPIIFAITRKKTITKRKYFLFCYGFNFFIWILFQIVNGGTFSVVPYYLWTRIFSARGLNSLEEHGILEGYQYSEVNITEDDATDSVECCDEAMPERESSFDEDIIEDSTTVLTIDCEEPTLEQSDAQEKIEVKKRTKKKEKFCKHCGNVLNGKNTHCTSCGKWFFAFRKQYLLYFFLIICIASLATTTIAYRSKLARSSNEVQKIAQNNQELLQKIDLLDKRIPEEYNKGYQNGKTDGYDDGYDAGESAGYTKGYSEGNTAGYNKGKSQAVVTVPKSTSVSSSTSYEPSCAIPSCSNSPQRNSFYCFRHECMDVSCHNQRASTICLYCINHKCAMPNCNSGQAYNSYYCYVHK